MSWQRNSLIQCHYYCWLIIIVIKQLSHWRWLPKNSLKWWHNYRYLGAGSCPAKVLCQVGGQRVFTAINWSAPALANANSLLQATVSRQHLEGVRGRGMCEIWTVSYLFPEWVKHETFKRMMCIQLWLQAGFQPWIFKFWQGNLSVFGFSLFKNIFNSQYLFKKLLWSCR